MISELIILMLTFKRASCSTISTSMYISDLDVTMTSVTSAHTSPSVSSCSVICQEGGSCESFSYNAQTNQCLLHPYTYQDSAAAVTQNLGFRLYYVPPLCNIGWLNFNESCYLFVVDRSVGWTAAQADCESLGGALVKVETSEEHEYIKAQCYAFNRPYYWIGAKYYAQYGEFRWFDGSVIEFNGFRASEPSTTGCADTIAEHGHNWNAHDDCAYAIAYICEKGIIIY